jgi:hypothetical protein
MQFLYSVIIIANFVTKQLVKHAPRFATKHLTTNTWDHRRRAITRFVVEEFVIADSLMTPRTCCGIILI